MSRKPLPPSPTPPDVAAPLSPPPLVRCAHTRLVDPATLQPWRDNPNKHPEPQLVLYDKILRHQGFRKSLVVSKQSGRIVTGNGAWETAMRQRWPLVPVDDQDFASPDDEKAHVLADNGLPQLAEQDDAAVKRMLEDLATANFNVDLTAFDVTTFLESGGSRRSPLVKLEVKPLPALGWALIGVPVENFGSIQAFLDTLPPGTKISTTVSNGRIQKNGQS